MEKNPKCSSKAHKDIEAISYCEHCKILMCNKCLTHHKELFENHQLNDVNKKGYDIFIDICKKTGHEKRYEFFCKKRSRC